MIAVLSLIPPMSNQFIVLIAGIGGIVIKIVEGLIDKWAISRKQHKDSRDNSRFHNEADRIRRELRAENNDLKKQLAQEQAETDKWREKYWREVENSATDTDSDEELFKLKARLRNQGLEVDSGEHNAESK